jgi:hypothetical protein
MTMPANCRSESCGAPIIYAWPAGGGKSMPINWPEIADLGGSECDHEGNLIVWRKTGMFWYRYAGKDEPLGPGEHRATSHFATCPEADMWRRSQ